MAHLHNGGEGTSPIDIDSIYLDTTFCHYQARDIITREKTREYIIEVVEM